MVILHVATTENDLCSGVAVAVKQYLINQSKIADVAFVNEKNESLCDEVPRFEYSKHFDISKLDSPFNNPDIVIFHEMYSFAFLRIYKQLIKRKIPYVIVPHGGLTKTAQGIKAYKKIPANIVFSKFYRKASCFHYLTNSEKENTIYPSKKSFIIPNGVSVLEPRTTVFNPNSIVFTYIGRFEIICKGLDILIQSIYEKKDLIESKNASFKLFGPIDGGHLLIENKIKELGLSNIVSVNGPVVGAEKERVLLSTTFFIQTSRSEGLPMGILEALSYSVPCCLSSGTSLTKIVEKYDAGFCSSTDAKSVGEMIEKALNCEDYQRLCKGAFLMVKENYSWDIVARDMIKQYKNIIIGQK